MSGQIRQLLREKFTPPAYALFEEVKNQTGYAKRTERYADALALSLWPSRGLGMTGFEIKVSRADWKKELGDPEKAAEFQKYCVAWYVVAPEGIVERLDLPSTWGLIEVPVKGRKRLVTRVEAPRLTPQAWDTSFVAALLRRQHEHLTSYVQEAVSAQLEGTRLQQKAEHEATLVRAAKGEAHYRAQYEGLLKRLGVQAYEPEQLDLALSRLSSQVAELKLEHQMGWKVQEVVGALKQFVGGAQSLIEQLSPVLQAHELAATHRQQARQRAHAAARAEAEALTAPGR